MNESFYINEILLPYETEMYEFVVDLEGVMTNFKNIRLSFNVITRGNLIGKCDQSKYCIRRNYL